MATYGVSPGTGMGLVDGTWLTNLAAGNNFLSQSGIAAAGSTQAGATPVSPGAFLIEVDTVASSTGVSLPFAYSGDAMMIYNNGANTLTVYPNVANNPATGAQDTINNSTSGSVNSHTAAIFFCAKDGVWAQK